MKCLSKKKKAEKAINDKAAPKFLTFSVNK